MRYSMATKGGQSLLGLAALSLLELLLSARLVILVVGPLILHNVGEYGAVAVSVRGQWP